MDLGELAKTAISGYLMNLAPDMMEGALDEVLKDVKLADLALAIKTNLRIWDVIPPQQQESFVELAPKVGDLEWLTLEWVMVKGRKSAPSLYSALTGWPEGLQWLESQINDIKIQLSGGY